MERLLILGRPAEAYGVAHKIMTPPIGYDVFHSLTTFRRKLGRGSVSCGAASLNYLASR